MKLSKCTMGIIIIDNAGHIGHVVGLATTSSGYPDNNSEVIPMIKWAGKEIPHAIHHGNIEIYKD